MSAHCYIDPTMVKISKTHVSKGYYFVIKKNCRKETDDMIIIQCIQRGCQWKCHLRKIIPVKRS